MNVVAYTERRGGDPLAAPPTELNPVGEFQMINVGDFRMIIDRASFESCFEQIPPGFPTVGASLTLFLTDGALLGLCSAWRCPPSCRFPGWVSSTRKATSPFLYFHTSRLYLIFHALISQGLSY